MDEKTKTCDGCGLAKEDLKEQVKSIRHTHPTASKIQKKIKADIAFRKSLFEKATLCQKCRTKVINGFAYGEMNK